MQAEDWQRLGLDAPTTDLLAIKRAYAAQLKRTRPDDDAEAYQALRQTYEWAQQWARWQAEAAPESPPLEQPAAPAPEATSPVAAPPPAGVVTPEPETVATPEELVSRAHQIWRQQGEAAFLSHWPVLRQGLEALPLSAVPEASARLAEFVIHEPDLPEHWLIEVDRHFGWREDFRTARLIGPQRAQALLQALDERIVRPISDPSVLAQLEPLLRVARLVRGGQRLKALVFALLSGGMLQALYDALPPRQWRALGFEIPTQTAVRAVMSRAGSVRLALAAALLGAVMLAAGMRVVEMVPVLGSLAIATLFLFFVAMWVNGLLGGWFGQRGLNHSLAARLRAWHAHPRRAEAGFVLLALSALAAWAGGAWAPEFGPLAALPWLAATLLAAMVLWPQDLRHGAVVLVGAAIGTWMALVSKTLGHGTDAAVPGSGALAGTIGLAWALVAGTAYERGWWGTRDDRRLAKPQVWLFAPIVNSLALCDRWGYGFALATAPLLVGFALVDVVRSTPWGLYIGWTLLVLAFGLGQDQLFKAGERLAGRWRA